MLNEISEKLKNADADMCEEIIYAEVLAEIKAGIRRDGLWAKALSESNGDINKTKALYIKYRAKSLGDEIVKYNKEQSHSEEEEKLKEEKLKEEKEEKEEKLFQEKNGAFGLYQQQFKNKLKEEKEEKSHSEEEEEEKLFQEKNGAFGLYQQQFKNKKKEVTSKNFFNSASRLRFWIVSFITLSAVYSSQQPGYEMTTTNSIFDLLIAILFIITCTSRAADCGRTRLWAIVMLVPVLNLVSFYYLGFTPSKESKNISR